MPGRVCASAHGLLLLSASPLLYNDIGLQLIAEHQEEGGGFYNLLDFLLEEIHKHYLLIANTHTAQILFSATVKKEI